MPTEQPNERDVAYEVASHFAKSLHQQYYSDGNEWGLCDTTAGVITQISNMVAGLERRLNVAQTRLQQVQAEPDWSTSETGMEFWKNPYIPMRERLLIADGAIAYRTQCARQQIESLEQKVKELEVWREKVFAVHPNIDLDIGE